MVQSRREFMVGAGLSLAALSAGGAANAAGNAPNILYVFSDEHRYQSMAHSEMPELKTPAMSRMAREGFEFRQCVSNYPVCSPYRALLLTGRWPYQTGVVDNNVPLRATEMTVAKAFQGAGYDTAYIGKWHLGGLRAEPHGFDHSLIWSRTGAHYDTSAYHPAAGAPVKPKGYNATLMTDQAIEYMTVKRDKPFMMMLSLNPPHANFLDAPPEKQALYPEDSLSFRPNYRDEGKAELGGAFRTSQKHYLGYHAHISAIDDELARLMDMLEQQGLAENTILIYTSDHGSMHGSHGVGSKRQPYEESVRVPFLVHAPGRVAPGVSDNLFSAIDIAPTLCGLAGIPVPETCVGQDFTPTLAGAPGPDPDSQFIMHIQKGNASHGVGHPAPIFRGVRTKTHTYAVGPDGFEQLFDNEADPYQMNNKAEDQEHATVRDTLRGKLANHLHNANDPYRQCLQKQ
jgi:arylsulfatase A-like enzyme